MPEPFEDDDYPRPPGFDLDGGWPQGEGPSLDSLASEYGWSSWRDVIAPDGSYEDNQVRPGIYYDPEDAINEAYNVGILDFCRIVYSEVDDVWYLVVDDDTGGGPGG